MDSASTHRTLVEEREEVMVLPSEINTRPTIKKSHLLKPYVPTIDGSETSLRPASSPCVKSSPLCVSFSGWRLPNQKFKSWFRKMSALHKPIWIKAGIFEAIKASTYKIRKNPSLILSLAQKWSPKTKTFVFPWGEATITLEDVTLLLGFSVLGSSVSTPLETSEMKESVLKLGESVKGVRVNQVSWISTFVDGAMEHEAFLVFWLSNFVFPDKQGSSISKHVFSLAVRLARGERIALAPAVLASLYRDLGKVHGLASSTQNVDIKALFKLVQVWIWERFKSIGPRPHVVPIGEPRIARWNEIKPRDESVRPFLLDDFVWRPFTKPLRNWNPPRFYNEKAKRVSDDDDEFVSFARCVRVSKLDGFGFKEDYYPNRVGMQFGLAQDLPGLAAKPRGYLTEKEACDVYNRPPLDGSKKHIPSRLTTASVSAAKYRGWLMKSVKEPTETLKASNTCDDDDDDDVPPKVLPLSQVFQKLGEGIKKAEQLTNKKRKQANENAMDCCETQDEEEDNITTARRIKCRNKCGDVKYTGDQRTSTEEDCNVPGLPQKLASGDEHNSSDPNVSSDGVHEKDEDGNTTIAQIIKLRDNVENNTEGVEYVPVVYNNVSGLPQKLASGDKTVAVPEIKERSEVNDETNNSSDALVASNGIAEMEEEEYVTVGERLNQRKLGTDELALKLEARMLKVEKTLAEIKQWKMGINQTKTPVSA